MSPLPYANGAAHAGIPDQTRVTDVLSATLRAGHDASGRFDSPAPSSRREIGNTGPS
jgi:hypothetical protein